MKATLRHIYLCRTANMSWRTCVVVKQIQSNPIHLKYKHAVMSQNVRPEKIRLAARYLCTKGKLLQHYGIAYNDGQRRIILMSSKGVSVNVSVKFLIEGHIVVIELNYDSRRTEWLLACSHSEESNLYQLLQSRDFIILTCISRRTNI